MIVQLRPNISVSRAVQLFKGRSSRIIWQEFPKPTEFVWGCKFLERRIFVETVVKVDFNKIKAYVQKQ